jgi:hypothetical protein
MKTFLLSVLSCAVAIGPILGAPDQDEQQHPKSKNRVAPVAPPRVNAPRTVTPRVQNTVAPKPQFQPQNKPPVTARTYAPPKSYTPEIQARLRNNSPKFTPPDQNGPRPTTTVRSNVNPENQDWRSRNRKNNPRVVTTQPPQSSTTVVQSNTNTRNRDWRNRTNNNSNWQNNKNRNWQNNTSGTFTFEEARRRHNRHHHDRSWWRSRYNRISLFGGGYYYWDNNYWYPAYGYDPYYSTYAYDEPIYGYSNLEPGQVIANVQTALQEQGYYRDAVDGLIGPRTRAAISNFQRDHNLSITAAIDGPTLQALGLY